MVLASLLYAALTNSKTAAAAKKKAEAYANATGPLPKLCRDCTTSIHMGCHAAKHGFWSTDGGGVAGGHARVL